MQTTQEIVELILDSNRNALLTLDLKVIVTLFDPALRPPCGSKSVIMQISIITMALGVGTLIAGMFGMNVCDLSP